MSTGRKTSRINQKICGANASIQSIDADRVDECLRAFLLISAVDKYELDHAFGNLYKGYLSFKDCVNILQRKCNELKAFGMPLAIIVIFNEHNLFITIIFSK